MVVSTVQDSIGSLGKAFQECDWEYPFHLMKGGIIPSGIYPRAESLLKAFQETDKPIKKQKAALP